jgi:hypothetical protein
MSRVSGINHYVHNGELQPRETEHQRERKHVQQKRSTSDHFEGQQLDEQDPMMMEHSTDASIPKIPKDEVQEWAPQYTTIAKSVTWNSSIGRIQQTLG